MKRIAVILGSTFAGIFIFTGGANAQPNVECDPFSIACGYSIPIHIGPFDIDVPIESVFPPQP